MHSTWFVIARLGWNITWHSRAERGLAGECRGVAGGVAVEICGCSVADDSNKMQVLHLTAMTAETSGLSLSLFHSPPLPSVCNSRLVQFTRLLTNSKNNLVSS